jgi:hypothetical protein
VSEANTIWPKFHLHDWEREVMLRLIAAHPLESCRKLAARFEAETGRKVCHQTVRKVMVVGYIERPANGNMTDAEREALAGLIREAGPGTPCRVVAERFEAACKRPITAQTVWRIRRKILNRETR